MATATLSLQEGYWEDFQLGEGDISFLYEYLLEHETPLSSEELMPLLVEQRIQREEEKLEAQLLDGHDIYLPRETYQEGQALVFPAVDWRKGEVVGLRTGENPEIGEFEVMQVEFEDGENREFAVGIEDHVLNQPLEAAQSDSLDQEKVIDEHRSLLVERIEQGLVDEEEFVQIAGSWFPRALLVDVNVGHLNLAEAVLDLNDGGPLPTDRLVEEIELTSDVNPNLVEFSLDLALQEDPRFDEVGPAGIILWYLKAMEPEEVQKTPIFLQYVPVDYDRDSLTKQMLKLEKSLADELTPWEGKVEKAGGEVEVRLIFPHWRVGSLPLSAQVKPLFPTAYEAPRIRFTLVDGKSGEKFPGWVVRDEKYVFGLKEWYQSKGLIPGGVVKIKPGENPGEVIVDTDSSHSTKNWMRTILVGSDEGLVFATLKQIVSSDYNERMAIVVPDVEPVDKVWQKNHKSPPPFEQVVVDMVRELTKLNPQGHVHVTELYAAVNTVRRCPPGPLMALLETRPWFIHVGDLHFRFDDTEGK